MLWSANATVTVPAFCTCYNNDFLALGEMLTSNNGNYGNSFQQCALSGLVQPFRVSVSATASTTWNRRLSGAIPLSGTAASTTASHDAFVFLSTGGSPFDSNGYEIQLGGWGNASSSITVGSVCLNEKKVQATCPVASYLSGSLVGSGKKTFIIEKTETTLTISCEDSILAAPYKTVLECDCACLEATEMYLMTGRGVSSEWSYHVESEGDMHLGPSV